METIGSSISRIRNITKTVKEDPFITDRFIYSLINKYAKMYIARQESVNQLLKFNLLFRTIPCMELIQIDRVEACCSGLTSDCLFKRTKDKVPGVMEAAFGPLFRTISSIDGSQEVFPTFASTYTSMSKTSTFKYNKKKYYWFLNGYLYFPDLDWDEVMIEAIFDGDINHISCNLDACRIIQDQPLSIPAKLFAEIEKQVLADLGTTINIPEQGNDDKQSPLR